MPAPLVTRHAQAGCRDSAPASVGFHSIGRPVASFAAAISCGATIASLARRASTIWRSALHYRAFSGFLLSFSTLVCCRNHVRISRRAWLGSLAPWSLGQWPQLDRRAVTNCASRAREVALRRGAHASRRRLRARLRLRQARAALRRASAAPTYSSHAAAGMPLWQRRVR